MPPMKADSFTQKLYSIATTQKTVYAWGMFGTPVTEAAVSGKAKQYPSWYTSSRLNNVFAPLYGSNPPAWGFDCVGLIKGVLWGWDGDASKSYGGAKYASYGVPDISADSMIRRCYDVSTDFSSISIGEFLWMKGHCGVYIGNGLAIESTPAWKNGVQVTACNCTKKGYNTRYWTKHGKLPYVEYVATEAAKPKEEVKNTVKVELTVLKKGSYGNEVKTVQRLLNALGHKGADKKVLTVDGDFGKNTDYALKTFQASEDIGVDGICGVNSWTALLK